MTNFKERLKDILYSEWLHFGKQSFNTRNVLYRRGKLETDAGFWQRIGVYWEMGTAYDLDGLDRDWPWSAAFISYCMRIAGAEEHFKYSIRHSDYIKEAVDGLNPFFVGHKVEDYSPKVGDLICYSRQNGLDYDNLPDKFISHSDIVVNLKSNYLEAIGGNIGHSVSKRNLKIDSNGILIDDNYEWFAVIENKMY